MKKKLIITLIALLSTNIISVEINAKYYGTYKRLEQPKVSYEFQENELGVVNFAPIWGDKAKNIEMMKEYIDEADKLGVKILLFPEMCVTGYASSSDKEDEIYKMPIELAESIEGPTATYFSKIADEKDMWVIYGATETIEGDANHAYNSAFACSPDGAVYSYQKLAPVEGEWCVPGNKPVLIDAGEYGLIGLSICYDTYANPEIERYYAANGCNILLNPTATSRFYKDIDNDTLVEDYGWEWYYKNRLETIASRDGMTILSSNLVGTDGPQNEDGTFKYNFPGGSVIMNATFKGAQYYAGEIQSNGKLTTSANIVTGEKGLITNRSVVTAKTGYTTSHADFAPELYAKWYDEIADKFESGESLSYKYTDTDGPLAAVVNMSAVWGDKQANLNKIVQYIEEAALLGVEFLVFPETVLTGYEYQNPQTDKLIDVDVAMQVELAETIPGATTNYISELSKKYGMYIVLGMTEKEVEPIYEDSTEKVYNSAAIMYPNGKIESFRKMHRAGSESEWSIPGNTPVIIDTEWGKFGIDICRDGHFYPELGRYYAAMGCNVLVHPTATTGNPWYREGRIGSYTDRDGMAAITCNLLGPDGIFDEQTNTWSGGIFNSTSLIITKYLNEDGKVIAHPTTGYPINLNGTGSESIGYDERKTSPEGLEVAQMNLSGTGFSIANFNPRLFSEMYDKLAQMYRKNYIPLTE
ncbi:hypothetical protein AN641_08470 [Candidatus Epulonipiscioides gigas]|nr:hypothetical protein AN641_08470 [Epulopiscium sp. SCG-C07WGA-EpuloA2]